MVQISTAEQEKLHETSASSIPLIDNETRGAVIDNMRAGEIIVRSIMIEDDPNMGWKAEEHGLDEELAASLVGAKAVVRVDGPFVRANISEIDPEDPSNTVMRECIGTLATIRYHATS